MAIFSSMPQENCKDHKLFILLCLQTLNLLTKPSQTLQNTQQRGKGRTMGKDPSPSQRHNNPKWVTKQQRNKLCSQALISCKKHITKGK